MAEFAHVVGGVVTEIINAEQSFIDTRGDAAEWYPATPGTGVGYSYDGGVFTDPDGNPAQGVPVETVRYLLTGAEWVDRWSDDEWDSLETLAQSGTANGKRLKRLMAAIRWSDSVNLKADRMVQFYVYIVARGWITQQRADELQQGVAI